MDKCQYITKKDSQIVNCKFISKYGCYCYKHRKYHLLDEEENIILENFIEIKIIILIRFIIIYLITINIKTI